MPKKSKKQLPNKILPIKCSDKSFQEKWHEGRDALNFVWSFAWCLCGPPNSGKSTIIKNHIIRADPPYEKIVICHYDAEGSDEYDDCGNVEYVDTLPDPKKVNPAKEKMLLIIEDLNLSTLNKEEKQKLDRLAGYSRSHRGVSLALTCQNSFDCPVAFRRMTNVFTLWKQPDIQALCLMARRTGYKQNDFIQFFKFCQRQHDSITIDVTDQTPYPLRLNGYQLIKKRGKDEDDEEEVKEDGTLYYDDKKK
jgi:hypothetical protein